MQICVCQFTISSCGFDYLSVKCQLYSIVAKSRNIELELVPTDDITIGDIHILVLKPLGEIKVSGQCATACQFDDFTYVGMHGGNIDRIDKAGGRTKGFIKLSSHVTSIRAHKDTLYTLMAGNPSVVYVHNLSGQLISSWSHPDNGFWGSKIAIVNDQLVIANRKTKRLTLYSPFGEVMRQVDVSQISNGFVSICESGRDSVIVSDYATSRVFKVNINSGDIVWMSSKVSGPLGVTCYGGSHVLVTKQDNRTTIWVLDIHTGMQFSIIHP